MHNALTESAKRVTALAAGEARAMNHPYVGTEHMLLGLLLEGSCDAGGTLRRLGLDADRVRNEIEKLVQRGSQVTPGDDLPLTPRAKRVILLASEEAACVNLPQAGPQHWL